MNCTVFGLDLAKRVFQLHWIDIKTGEIYRQQLRRGQVAEFFANRKPCVIGFIAPILGVITLQKEIVTGVAMMFFFAIGHCLPLVVCGMFSARTMELLHSHSGQKLVVGMRKFSAVIVAGLGVYFTVIPFV